MSDNTKDNDNNETKNEEKKETVSEEKSEDKREEASESKKGKTKFTFKCTRCDKCCLSRGPIPITFWDLELWAKNGVVANFMPYLEIYTKPDGSFDLILKPLPPPKEGSETGAQEDPLKETPIEELLEEKCPLYNKDQKKCLIYDNRPLSCRTYPLEFDGKNFSVVDVECPGIGQEGMSKEELKNMRDTAKTMNYELTRIRIALPVLNQVVTRKIMMDLMKQQMETMSKLSEEDRKKLDEILGKSIKQEPNPV
ncbi:MAG: YkgJ family cysteine cluster protein [Promethearchaeota archaeon]